MSNEAESSILRERFLAAASAEWDAVIAADELEPNMEMLAGYLDGGLDEAGRERVARHIAESPRAWDLLQTMLEPGQVIPLCGDSLKTNSESPTTPPRTSLPTPKFSAPWFQPVTTYAVAASLLLAVTFGVVAWRSTSERREIESRLAQTQQVEAERLRSSRELVGLVKRNVDAAAAEYMRPVFAGSSDTRHTLASLKKAMTGNFRGPNETEEAQLEEAAAEAQRSIASAVRSFPEDALNFRLEEAAVLIAARQLDAADTILKTLESENGSNSSIRNARGAWLVHKARISSSTETESLLAQAEALLKSAAADEPLAWLNLFELYDARRDRAAAVAAARSYAAAVQDPEITAFVERQFGAPLK